MTPFQGVVGGSIPLTRSMMNKKVFIILLAAFLIRLVSLNQSLWLDEAATAKVVQHFGFTQIVSGFSPNDFHPPLYYLFMKFWTDVFGFSEISLRMPSVIFSLLAGLIIYKIGTLLKNKSAGLWSAALFLFNPLIVYYSQEARMYMTATFLLTCSLYYFIKMLQNQKSKIKNIFLFNLFCILSFYTFYGSVFLIAGFLIYIYYKKHYRLFFLSLIFNLLSLILISPLLTQQFIHARQSLQIVMNWKQVLGTATIKNLLLIPLKFSSGRISFNPKIVYYLIAGAWSLFIWCFIIRAGFKKRLLLFLIICSLGIGLLFSFVSPLLQYFRFLYLIPIMSILLAFALQKQIVENATVYRYAVAVGFLAFSFVYLLFPQFHREDWKSLGQSFKNTRSVYMIIPSSDPVRYYSPAISIRELRTLEGIELEKEITVIPYTADIYGFDYKKELQKKGFTYKETKSFRGLWYEIWVRNKGYAGSFRYSLKTART